MPDLYPKTAQNQYRRLRSVNSTDAAYPARAATLTAPSGVGNNVSQTASSAVIDLSTTPFNNIRILPFGTAASGVFTCRVLGWHRVLSGFPGNVATAPTADTWIPTILAEYTCTIGSYTGVANGAVLATENFASTLVIVANMGNANVDTTVLSPANNTPGWFMVDMKGAERLEILFAVSTAAQANCLYQLI